MRVDWAEVLFQSFLRDALVSSSGMGWEGCPLLAIVYPAFPLPTVTSPVLQNAPQNGFGEAAVTRDMPELCKFPSLDVVTPQPWKLRDKESVFSLCTKGSAAETGNDVRPIAHWRRFKIRQQASTPGDSAGRATDTRYQRLYSHASNKRTQQFSARCSMYSKASTREDKSSKWLHPASLPIKTIIWCCFAAGVDAVTQNGCFWNSKQKEKVFLSHRY